MRIEHSLPAAACFLYLLLAGQASAQVSHVFFDTTGDFGVNDNWSDPAKAPPEKPPGIGLEHLSYFYYINGDRTATISAGSPNGSHFQVQQLFPGDSPPNEPPSPGTLILEGGAAPGPGQFGASLEVLGTNRFILGQRCNMGGTANGMDPCTGNGQVHLNGASDITADGVVVGERDEGALFIGPEARVRSGHVTEQGAFSRQDIRIGSFGPSRGETENPPVRLEGNGLVVVEGTFIGNTIFMPESGATGELRLMPGGRVDIRNFNFTFDNGRASRSSKLSVIGSGGFFRTITATSLANHPSVTFAFTADANGVTPIVIGAMTAPLGDYSLNGVVDAADYVVWRKTLGSTTNLQANGDNTGASMGVIDQADYNFWRTNFGGVGARNSATIEIEGANLELNLDAYQFTPESRLVLIDAGDFDDFGEKVFGQFGNVTFIGNTTAEVVYDLTSGDVYLQNFQRAGAAATSAAVPEPGSLTGLLLVVAHLCFARWSRQRVA